MYRKRFLPNYGVFDEDRYFAPGRDLVLLEHGKTLIGPTVCEDMWQPGPPATDLALAGAELLVNISASPFYVGRDRRARGDVRHARARQLVLRRVLQHRRRTGRADLRRALRRASTTKGKVIARAPGFEEALLFADIEPQEVIGRRLRDVRRRALARERETIPPVDIIHVGSRGPSQQREQGHRRGRPVRRRAGADASARSSSGSATTSSKNGFREVVVGVSGGIDSAVTAALAAEALGPERVHCVSMPSRYSSEETRVRRATARREPRLSVQGDSDRHDRRRDSATRSPVRSQGREPDLAEENIQARARGVLLMALSNKFGWMLVATGNKSELSVGYATLYGDMAGGFALLKDVYKTDVFRLARYLNERAGSRADPDSRSSSAPRAPSCVTTSWTRTRSRRTRSSTKCSSSTSSTTARSRSSQRTASTATSSSARSRWSTGRSTSAVRRRRA